MGKKQKGQISIFIIIGVIMMVVAVFLLYNSDVELFESHDTKMKNQISTIVEDCIEKSALNGAFMLGLQGGYIDIPEEISQDPRRYIDMGFKFPNWDTEKKSYPTIRSMEVDLNNYVRLNGYSCIQSNLKAQESVFNITYDSLENFIVDSQIEDYNIVLSSEYLIKFNEKKSEEILTLEEYNVKLDDLRLGDLYNLAMEIYNTEKTTYLFEELVMDQIGSANDYSSKDSMPTEGFSLSCEKRAWSYDQLKSNLMNLNNNNFRYLQLDGTYDKDYYFDIDFSGDEDAIAIHKPYYDNIYTKPLMNSKSSFENYQVDVSVPQGTIMTENGPQTKFPFRSFEVFPSSGSMVKSVDMKIEPESVKGVIKIPIPCMQVFNHKYSLDYDLMVQLTDKTDTNSRGFIFQFPMKVEIVKNNAKIKSGIDEEVGYTGSSNEEYCREENRKYPVVVQTFVDHSDGNKNPISGVDISYKCLSLECDIGTTKKEKFLGITIDGALPEVREDYPYCFGGSIIAKKEGYHTLTKRINTDNTITTALENANLKFMGNVNSFDLNLIPYKIFSISESNFMAVDITDPSRYYGLVGDNGDKVFMTVENTEYDFSKTVIWPMDEENTLELLNKEDVVYNLSLVYTGLNDELKGIIDIQNWTPKVKGGNTLRFKIPVVSQGLTEDMYEEYFLAIENANGLYDPSII